jgi:hypothetical protein
VASETLLEGADPVVDLVQDPLVDRCSCASSRHGLSIARAARSRLRRIDFGTVEASRRSPPLVQVLSSVVLNAAEKARIGVRACRT